MHNISVKIWVKISSRTIPQQDLSYLATNGRSLCPKADLGLTRLFESFGGLFFVNFDCITRVYFYCSHHTVLTIRTVFSTVTKNIGYVKGDIKTNPRPQKLYRAGTAPPVFEILRSATPFVWHRGNRESLSHQVWHSPSSKAKQRFKFCSPLFIRNGDVSI